MSNPYRRHGGNILPPGSAVVLNSGRTVPVRDPSADPSQRSELDGNQRAELDNAPRYRETLQQQHRPAQPVRTTNRSSSLSPVNSPQVAEVEFASQISMQKVASASSRYIPATAADTINEKSWQNNLSPSSGSSSQDAISRLSGSQRSYEMVMAPKKEAVITTHEALTADVEQPGNLPSYNTPVGQRRRMHQIGYRNMFNDRGTFRWKHRRLHQLASQVYASTERIRYRDAVGRVFEDVEEDRFIHPLDHHLARMMVQCTDEVYSGPANATWRRTFIRNMAPWAVRLANWPFNTVTADKKHWDSHDWTMICIKWPVSCICLTFALLKPGRLYDGVAPSYNYLDFHYKYWGYPKVARNALEIAPDELHNRQGTSETHAISERPLHPRRLCFLNSKDKVDSPITLYDTVSWMAKHNLIEDDMHFVFVAYTSSQFSHDSQEDMIALHEIAKTAARDAGVSAYWLGASCMSEEQDELENDVYRISDVIRGAHSMVIAIKPANGRNESTETMLKDWGKRMWTLPEALLSPKEQPLRIYSSHEGSVRFIKEVYKKNLAALIWEDSSLTRQLVEHYEGNLTLSRLELVILALRCLGHRSTSKYLDGDMAYVLMGLLRQRPIVDRTDSAFQAFARLSLANDSDNLLERLLCVLPRYSNQPWHHTEDAYKVSLWDIQPTCQIAGVGEEDTVILDGCYGASIRWETFLPVHHDRKASWKRRTARLIIRLGALGFLIGILFAIIAGSASSTAQATTDSFTFSGYRRFSRRQDYGSSSSSGGLSLYASVAVALIMLSLPVWLSAPHLVRVCYGGKAWNVSPHFFGFEGYLDLATIESNIYGAPMGRLSWSTAGSNLSRHRKNEFGECIGEDPTSDPAVADLVRGAKYSAFGQMKIFTLVDTRQGLVTLFESVRPPTAILMCGQEGGMQRAVLVSLDWKRQTLFRETVLRMPTVVLERMYRVNRVRIGLKRPLDQTVLRLADTVQG